jgi:uncharacterized 2Fe-2S/4Fe-4S cluster protein (DUF4445 family)
MPLLPKHHISFLPTKTSVDIFSGTSLFEAAWVAGIRLASACGGNGKCLQCRVTILEGEASPLMSQEMERLSQNEIELRCRLACCTHPLSDLRVYIPEKSLLADEKLQVEATDEGLDVDPVITGPQAAPPLGIAIDLGTTKIATYLMDLFTGKELASMGAINPQAQYGADIMTRLHYAINNTGTAGSSTGRLTEVVRGAIIELVAKLTEKSGVELIRITDLCIVGNTAMIHLLLGLPIKNLTAPPYTAAVKHAIDLKAIDLGIVASPGAYVHVLPGVESFVGSDHVAMILATGIDQADDITLGLDIGTNTEIVISLPDKGQMISASCPSGPAFEGAHVTDGMQAMRGAIESLKLTETGVEYRTIGGAPAIGLCGSGIIDIAAELYKWRIIDNRGRLKKTNPRVLTGKQGLEFQVTPGSGTHGDARVVITQKDIDQIQLAKGAIWAGIAALLEVAGISYDMVKEVIIAGAFGSFINIENAININLLPWFPNAGYRQVGNAAGLGAKMALLSKGERIRVQQIAARTRYLELTTHAGFNKLFASGMMFPQIA